MAIALTYTSPGVVALREVAPEPLSDAGDCRVRTLWSGISRGTERLIFEGRVPPSEYQRMRAPFQTGDFPFPVKYGYAAVGIVEQGPAEHAGKPVFCLFPHQDHFTAPASALTILPQNLPPRRAVLGANMETALNAIWDAAVGPGDRVAIVGGGILGGLLAGLLGQIPGTETTLIDLDTRRETLASHMNVSFCEPGDAPADCDIVFHTTSSASGAATALGCAGIEARIIEMSWFGDTAPALPLGGGFHAKRLIYQSSQVGMVSASRRPRWSYARRMAKALDLLCDPKYDSLITNEVAFADLPAKLPAILAPGAAGLATVVSYEE